MFVIFKHSLNKLVSLLRFERIIVIALVLRGLQCTDKVLPTSLPGIPSDGWVKASNCSELYSALQNPVVQVVLVHGTVQCAPTSWVDVIALDRDVQILGSSSTSSLEWGNSLEKVSLAPLGKLVLANLVLVMPTLQDVRTAKFAGLRATSTLLMSGVTFGVKSCSHSASSLADDLKEIARPSIFKGDQEVSVQSGDTMELVSHGEELGSGFIYRCKSLVICRWALHEAHVSLVEKGLSAQCGEAFGIKFSVVTSNKWLNALNLQELVGVAVAIGAVLATACCAGLVRFRKRTVVEEAPKTEETSGAFCVPLIPPHA